RIVAFAIKPESGEIRRGREIATAGPYTAYQDTAGAGGRERDGTGSTANGLQTGICGIVCLPYGPGHRPGPASVGAPDFARPGGPAGTLGQAGGPGSQSSDRTGAAAEPGVQSIRRATRQADYSEQPERRTAPHR